jgi:hypothetical protein
MRMGLAGCVLPLLLASIVSATAQERAPTCAEREAQIRSALDDVARLSEEAAAKKTRCVAVGVGSTWHDELCGAYASADMRQNERKSELEALMKDPAWRRCPASAAARFTPAGVGQPVGNPGEGSARIGQSNGRGPAGTGTGGPGGGPTGSQNGGSGLGSSRGNLGTGPSGGPGGGRSPNTQIASGGSSDYPSSTKKGGHYYSGKRPSKASNRPESRRVANAGSGGRNGQHRRHR